MKLINISHMRLFGHDIVSLPSGYYGTGEFRRSLPMMMTVYTRASIPVNLNNHPNELKF